MKRTIIISALLLLAVIIGWVDLKTPPEIDIELTTLTPIVKADETPHLSVSLENRGWRSVTLVQPGDGSLDGGRTPVISWTGFNPDFPRGRCGNINALKKDEIFTIAPGEKVQLNSGWIQASFLGQFPTQLGTFLLQPGTYEVGFNYSKVPKLKWTGIPLGRHDWFAMRRLRNSTPFEGTSNTVKIVVVDPSK